MRDYQLMRQRRWEIDHVRPHFHRILTWDEIHATVSACCALYGVTPPTIKTVKERINSQRTAYALDDHTIILPKWARTKAVTIHETAHIIMHSMGYTGRVSDHGPEFVRVFINLISMTSPRMHPKMGGQHRTGEVSWMMDHLERTAAIDRVDVAPRDFRLEDQRWKRKR